MNGDKGLRGLQTIAPDGTKSFMYGMEKTDNFHMIAEPGKDLSKDLAQGEIILAEGYATGATLHMATEKPVAVAFDAGNLESVAKKLREKFPNAVITICADNDHKHTRRTPEGADPGTKVWNWLRELPKRSAARLWLQSSPMKNGLTDFNDLHQSRGLDEVKRQVGLVLQKDIGQEKDREWGKARELSL
jgi:phage/plasmid primase-like uncharacterized protein